MPRVWVRAECRSNDPSLEAVSGLPLSLLAPSAYTRSAATSNELGRVQWQPDLNRRSPARRRPHVEVSPGTLHAEALGGETDVTLRESLVQLARVEATAVVRDGEADFVPDLRQSYGDVASRGVAADVDEQLAGDCEEDLLLWVAARIVQGEPKPESATPRRTLAERAKPGLEPPPV